jgi:hypothetical protein
MLGCGKGGVFRPFRPDEGPNDVIATKRLFRLHNRNLYTRCSLQHNDTTVCGRLMVCRLCFVLELFATTQQVIHSGS